MFLFLMSPQDEILNNITRSELSFSPMIEDDMKLIVCRAENPDSPGLFLETTWKLNVVCKYMKYISLRIFILSY